MFIKFEDIQKLVKANVDPSVVIGVVVGIILLSVAWRRRHWYYLSWVTEGPMYKPFVGNLLDFGFSSQRIHESLHEHKAKYKTVTRSWFGPLLGVVVTDPDDAQIVFKHEHSQKKPFMYMFAKEWVGNGIITAETEVWKPHRKLIALTFNRKILEHYMHIFETQSNIFVEQLAPHCGTNNYIDVFNYASRLTLDIICETTMGININAQTGDEFGDLYIKSSQKVFEVLHTRVMRMWLMLDSIFKMTSLSREYMKCVEVFHTLTNKVVAAKQSSLKAAMIAGEQETFDEQKSFVDQLFHQASIDNKNWTTEEIKDEISSMIAAGGDTTSHNLSFTIILLAMFPEIQEKVYQEILSIEEINEGDGFGLNMEACSKMTYTEKVLKESLRLFPSAPIIARQCTGNVKLKTKDIVVPKGVNIVIAISVMHRDKEFWGENADKFDPENFSKENVAKRHPNCFVAFSGGQRNCVGTKFTILSMKTILYKLLKAYRLETDEKFEDIKCQFHLLLDKVGGWRVKLYPRN